MSFLIHLDAQEHGHWLRSLFFAAIIAWLPSVSDAENLIRNGSFSGSYQDWGNPYILPPDPRRLGYSREIGSGSVQLISWRPGAGLDRRGIVLTQCVDISPGQQIEYGASAYAPASQPADEVRGWLILFAFTVTGCEAYARSNVTPDSLSAAPGEYWQRLRQTYKPDSNIASVEVVLAISKGEGVTEDRVVYFDDVYLRETADTNRSAPPSVGLWWNPGRPGSGITIDRQGDVVTAAIYGFDEGGQAQWLVGSGPLEDGFVVTPLFSAQNGACFNCPFQSPQLNADQVATFEFTSSDTALMRLGLEPAVPIRTFWFATESNELGEEDPQLGFAQVPNLSGRWVFANAADATTPYLRLFQVDCCVVAPADAGQDVALSMVFTDEDTGETLQLACVEQDALRSTPYCALVADPSIPSSLWQPEFAFHVSDIGINQITASLDGPTNAADNVIRGTQIVYGFRIP